MTARQYLGLDLGGTRLRAALANEDGAIVRRLEVATDRRSDEGLVRQILELAEEARQGQRLARIAVGAPGPLDSRTGVLSHPVNFSRGDIPLKAHLEDRFGVPAHVHNDANVAALGEWTAGGHGERVQDLIYLTVSTGVGAGVISGGRLLEGFNTTAGEIGHSIVDPDGPLCGWGHRGCVEIICSGTSIARAAREQGLDDDDSARAVAEAAAAGREPQAGIFRHAADVLGIAVVNLIHLFSPEVVVIGGGVAQAGELLFGPVRERVRHDAMPSTAEGVRIVPAILGDDAGLIGAISLAMRESQAGGDAHGT